MSTYSRLPYRAHRAYTLLELIVSVGIFSIVMLAATSAYLSLISLDRQARATTDVVTNLSFVVDSMSREIRSGNGYRCNNNATTPNCTITPGTSFRFMDSRLPSREIIYTLSNGQIFMSINGGAASAFTDPRVNITTLAFYVSGVGTTGANSYLPPRVTFVLRGTLNIGNGKTVEFSLQGSATQRFLELAT